MFMLCTLQYHILLRITVYVVLSVGATVSLAADLPLTCLQYVISCRYFCLASLAQFPVVLNAANSHSSIDSSSSSKSTSCPCQATPSLLLQLKQSGADQQIIQAAAQQHMVSDRALKDCLL